MGAGSNFNMAQIFNPKNYGKFWILFLGKKKCFYDGFFNSIFAAAAKKNLSFVAHTLLLKTSNNLFLRAKFCH
jgi:hypothetical protein